MAVLIVLLVNNYQLHEWWIFPSWQLAVIKDYSLKFMMSCKGVRNQLALIVNFCNLAKNSLNFHFESGHWIICSIKPVSRKHMKMKKHSFSLSIWFAYLLASEEWVRLSSLVQPFMAHNSLKWMRGIFMLNNFEPQLWCVQV